MTRGAPRLVFRAFANEKWYVSLKAPSSNLRLRVITKIPRFIGTWDIAYEHFGFYYICGYSAFIPVNTPSKHNTFIAIQSHFRSTAWSSLCWFG